MLTKGNDAKIQNEVMAQIVADTSAKWMKFTRLLPKQEIQENSQYYTYMSQRVNIEEAIQSGILGEAKDIAPGATLQELNVRKPISETVSIDTIGGVLNVSAQMLDSNLISINDMLQDVGILIGRSIEKAAINMIENSSKVTSYDFESSDDTGMTILKAQEKYKEKAGSFANLNTMAVSYKSLTTLKSDLITNNRQVEPVEVIESYYGVDNIDLLGTAVCDGGSEIGDKTYIGMDYMNPGMKLLYSRSTGTTVAPFGPDGEMYNFYPLIEFMRKDIRDELPMYTKLFILSSVGVLMNAPNRIIKGTFRE
ncbi:phage major capsid protein [Methanobrevibacter smithii]|uniref:phage major capsid protein n=1 Tax=Methanobrevibacter smithii TaxID=2173 RepID=UPI0037DCECC2